MAQAGGDREPGPLDGSTLARQAAVWADNGIITAEQADGIVAFQAIGRPRRSNALQSGRIVAILATLGAVLVGVGAILFVASNWQEIPKLAKLATVLVGTAAAYAAGYRLKYSAPEYPRIGEALLFLASIFFGAGIFLVAQIYHFNANNPYLHVAWFVGVFPLAYLVRSRAIMALAVVLGFVDIGLLLDSRLGIEALNGPWFGAFLIFGAMVYAIGLLQGKFRYTGPFAQIYTVLGGLVAFLFVYILTFEGLWKDLVRGFRSYPDVGAGGWTFIVVISVIAVGALVGTLGLAARRGLGQITLRYEAGMGVVLILAAYVTILAQQGSPLPYVIGFNVVLILMIVGAVVAGIVTGREALVNLGLVFFAVDVITRYLEIAAGMFQTSLFFMAGGVLLLVLGLGLERVRKRLLQVSGPQEVRDGA